MLPGPTGRAAAVGSTAARPGWAGQVGQAQGPTAVKELSARKVAVSWKVSTRSA
jgi:hypothetical protein